MYGNTFKLLLSYKNMYIQIYICGYKYFLGEGDGYDSLNFSL